MNKRNLVVNKSNFFVNLIGDNAVVQYLLYTSMFVGRSGLHIKHNVRLGPDINRCGGLLQGLVLEK
ncbi:hypothetical protein ALT785_700016 [Alteromonas infernus]